VRDCLGTEERWINRARLGARAIAGGPRAEGEREAHGARVRVEEVSMSPATILAPSATMTVASDTSAKQRNWAGRQKY
jgi:hypothetical protein